MFVSPNPIQRPQCQYNNIFDNSVARADLGFEYTILWQDGVRRIVNWLDERELISDADEPAFYSALLDAWQRTGTGMVNDLASFRA